MTVTCLYLSSRTVTRVKVEMLLVTIKYNVSVGVGRFQKKKKRFSYEEWKSIGTTIETADTMNFPMPYSIVHFTWSENDVVKGSALALLEFDLPLSWREIFNVSSIVSRWDQRWVSGYWVKKSSCNRMDCIPLPSDYPLSKFRIPEFRKPALQLKIFLKNERKWNHFLV